MSEPKPHIEITLNAEYISDYALAEIHGKLYSEMRNLFNRISNACYDEILNRDAIRSRLDEVCVISADLEAVAKQLVVVSAEVLRRKK